MSSPLGTHELDEMHDHEDCEEGCDHYPHSCEGCGGCDDDPRYEDGDYAHDTAKEDGR